MSQELRDSVIDSPPLRYVPGETVQSQIDKIEELMASMVREGIFDRGRDRETPLEAVQASLAGRDEEDGEHWAARGNGPEGHARAATAGVEAIDVPASSPSEARLPQSRVSSFVPSETRGRLRDDAAGEAAQRAAGAAGEAAPRQDENRDDMMAPVARPGSASAAAGGPHSPQHPPQEPLNPQRRFRGADKVLRCSCGRSDGYGPCTVPVGPPESLQGK